MSEILTEDKEEVLKSDLQSKDNVVKEESIEESNASSEDNDLRGFEGFGFSSALLKTIESKGYKEPSPIQKAAKALMLLFI